ncbi:MAG: D-2-hydroxyacid dehydrogenase [Ilumatobacteraceae bacterium]
MSSDVIALWYPAAVHGGADDVQRELAWLRDAAPGTRFLELFDRRLDDLDDDERRDLARASAAVVLPDPAELIEWCPALRWVQTITTGVDHVSLDALATAGIRIASANGTSGAEIAEFVLARLLEHWKQLPTIAQQQRDHEWTQRFGRALHGSHVVLVGFGSINQHVARLLRALDVRVTALRRHADAPPEPAHRVVALDDASSVLGEADAVIVALPSTPDTEGMFDAAWFTRMRPGAFFCNVGRGALVVEADLVAAVTSGHLGGAAVDVTASEPLPADDPLWDTPVRVSPHCASVPPQALHRVLELVVENLRRWSEGGELVNEIRSETV